VTESSPISLVCLDLAGIVIDDSVVERAYAEAIATQGIVPGTQDYARSMVRFDRSRGRRTAGPGGGARVRPLVPRGRAAVRRLRPVNGGRRDRQGRGIRRPGRSHDRAVQVRL